MNASLTHYMPLIANAVAADMPDEERYLFDLRGFLLLRNAIEPEVLANACAVADRFQQESGLLPEPAPGSPTSSRFNHVIGQHEAFVALCFSPQVIARVVNLIVYPKLKSNWFDLKAKGGSIGYHSNHTPYLPVDAYHCHQGRIHCNLLTVCFALTDIPRGGGALEVIPGSHKANFALPADDFLAEARVELPMKKGDVLLFTHDMNHGSKNNLPYVRQTFFASFSTGFSANTLGTDSLYQPLFETSPDDSWQKYLLRAPKGDRDTYPQPKHGVLEESDVLAVR